MVKSQKVHLQIFQIYVETTRHHTFVVFNVRENMYIWLY